MRRMLLYLELDTKVSRAISRKDKQEVRKARKTLNQCGCAGAYKENLGPSSVSNYLDVFTFRDSVPQERMMPFIMKQNIHLVQELDSLKEEIHWELEMLWACLLPYISSR